jgi:hypothetical protein
MRLPALILAIVSTAAPLAEAGSKKPALPAIRLHGEGNPTDGDSFSSEIQLTNPPKKIFMRKVPVVNEQDFKAFFPFPGNDGLSGAYFLLDAHGTNKLHQFSTEDRGRIAVVLVNGRVAAALLVDKPVNDGILMVPGGIAPEEILALQQRLPVIGAESEFGKKPRKKEKPAAE